MAFAMLGLISIGGGAGVMWWLTQGGGGSSVLDDSSAVAAEALETGQGTETPGVVALDDSSQAEDTAATALATAAGDTAPTAPAREPEPQPQRPPVRETQPAVQQPVRETPPAPTTGGIRFRSLPQGAAVLLNARPQNVPSNGLVDGLAPRYYRLVIRAPGRDLLDREVRVVAGQVTSFTYDAPYLAYLWIRIRPASGGDVFLDGRPVATATAEYRDTLVAGVSHTIRVTKDGFAPSDTTFTLSRGENEVRVILRRN
jgi:hypothetical protein